MSIDPVSIGASIGFGGIAGFLIGYAVKKVMKIMLVIIGLFFAALGYLASQGIISVNWDKLAGASTGALTGVQNATGTIPSARGPDVLRPCEHWHPADGQLSASVRLRFHEGLEESPICLKSNSRSSDCVA
ncbi:FUN14 domain-containing protein [Candidatus Nitrososphaera sp. FF02]|uniref:FUN14 domain-containing protein n=1 Tax=Candidatus Nitrososphaera sp. FF02 TaxID=3398226 RepID=UPI0039E9DAFE